MQAGIRELKQFSIGDLKVLSDLAHFSSCLELPSNTAASTYTLCEQRQGKNFALMHAR